MRDFRMVENNESNLQKEKKYLEVPKEKYQGLSNR
jgi:hypothetical protein